MQNSCPILCIHCYIDLNSHYVNMTFLYIYYFYFYTEYYFSFYLFFVNFLFNIDKGNP